MATTRQATKRRTYELIKEGEKVMKERCKKLLEDENIDFSAWDDDYMLPRVIFSAVASTLEREFKPKPTSKATASLLKALKAHL